MEEKLVEFVLTVGLLRCFDFDNGEANKCASDSSMVLMVILLSDFNAASLISKFRGIPLSSNLSPATNIRASVTTGEKYKIIMKANEKKPR